MNKELLRKLLNLYYPPAKGRENRYNITILDEPDEMLTKMGLKLEIIKKQVRGDLNPRFLLTGFTYR